MTRIPAHYDVAQVCLNGHMINDTYQSRPEFSKRFCPLCGAKTITACPACEEPIQGAVQSQFSMRGSRYLNRPPTLQTMTSRASVPIYCHNCGKRFPWTAERIAAAQALAEELDELSAAEKLLLQSSIDDLVSDTPKTTVAVARFKKLMSKTGRQAAEGFKSVLIDVVTEVVKKQLWP